MIRVDCACGRTLKLKDELAGKRVRCPDCGTAVQVPHPAGASPPPQPQVADSPPPSLMAGAANLVGKAGSALSRFAGSIPGASTRQTDAPPQPPPLQRIVPAPPTASSSGALPAAPILATGGVPPTLFERLTAQKQDPNIVAKVIERVLPILTAQESLQYVAVQQRPIVNWFPDCVVLTDRRLLLYRPKLLGRVDFIDYIWRDLHQVRLQENIIGATLSFQHLDGVIVALDYLPKEQARMLYRYAQEREEAVREERRLRQMEEDRARAGGTQILQQIGTAATPGAGPDPMQKLQQLKQLLEAGLLAPHEYEAKRAEVLSQI